MELDGVDDWINAIPIIRIHGAAMVCHGSHQYTPFLLALIYQHHGSYGIETSGDSPYTPMTYWCGAKLRRVAGWVAGCCWGFVG